MAPAPGRPTRSGHCSPPWLPSRATTSRSWRCAHRRGRRRPGWVRRSAELARDDRGRVSSRDGWPRSSRARSTVCWGGVVGGRSSATAQRIDCHMISSSSTRCRWCRCRWRRNCSPPCETTLRSSLSVTPRNSSRSRPARCWPTSSDRSGRARLHQRCRRRRQSRRRSQATSPFWIGSTGSRPTA